MQYSVEVRDAKQDAIDGAVGPAPMLEIRSGEPPAQPSMPDQGVLLAAETLPEVWLEKSREGRKRKAGIWKLMPINDGTPGHFRIKQGGKTHMQGTVTRLDDGGDMEVDRVDFRRGQVAEVVEFATINGNR